MAGKSWRGMFLGGLAAEGDPTAPADPIERSENAVLHRANEHPGPYNPSANIPREDPIDGRGNPQEESSKHVFYAVELLIFALIGWGWLAVREYLGNTPVMDAVMVISLLVCTVVNLVLALTIPSQLEFAPCAHAYFTHCVALWILYIYSLSESMRLDAGSLCCVDGSGNRRDTYSAGPTHAAAFFGGLPMHQVPGVVSVAYLSVFLLIAGAQARVCTPQFKDWVVRGLGLSIASMAAMHLAVYFIGVPMCDKDQAWGIITLLVALVAVFLIVDLDWVLGMVYVFFFRSVRDAQQRRDHRLIRGAIQTVGLGFLLFFCLVVSLVVEKSLSVPLLILFIACLVVSMLGLGYDALTLYGSDVLGIKAWEPEPESSGRTLGARMRPGMHAPPHTIRSRSADSRGVGGMQGPFLRRYPIFLQGQLNRGRKSN